MVHTKRVLYISALVLAVFVPISANAVDQTLLLSETTLAKGYTWTSPDKSLRLGILPRVEPLASATLDLTRGGEVGDAAVERVGEVWTYDFHLPDGQQLSPALRIRFTLPSVEWTGKERVMYSGSDGVWKTAAAVRADKQRTLSASLGEGAASIAVVRPRQATAIGAVLQTPMKLKAVSAAVVDQDTGRVIFQKNGEVARPLASLTKLATAKVFLAQQPEWKKVVALEKQDTSIGGRLYAAPGEKLTLRDAFATTLVGSANNTAKLLAHSTQLGKEDFIAQMNASAKAMGLTKTQFTEASGLDEHNVSTALEFAQYARAAFAEKEIQKTTTLKSYFFKMHGTGRPHTIKSTDLVRASGLTLLGTKTGYIDESMYNFAVAGKDPQSGHSVVVVLLGAPTSSTRFAEGYALLKAGLQQLKKEDLGG